LLQKDLKSIQDENPIPHSLDPSNLKPNFNSSKAKSMKNSNMFFFDEISVLVCYINITNYLLLSKNGKSI